MLYESHQQTFKSLKMCYTYMKDQTLDYQVIEAPIPCHN